MCQSNLYQAAQLTNRQDIRVSRSKVTFIKFLNRKVKKNNDMVKKLFFIYLASCYYLRHLLKIDRLMKVNHLFFENRMY